MKPGEPTAVTRDGPPRQDLLGHVKDPALERALASAAVVVLPEGSLEGKQLFQPETKDFFDFFKQHAPKDVSVEIASSDEDYAEKALHGAEIWVPTLLFIGGNPNVVSVVLNVLSNYIYDRLKGMLTRDTRVHSIVILDLEKRTASITYDGPSDAYVAVVRQALSKLPPAEDDEWRHR